MANPPGSFGESTLIGDPGYRDAVPNSGAEIRRV
jgi:hypothetical protein